MNNHSQPPLNDLAGEVFSSLLKRRDLLFGVILLLALVGFEMFNFSTTQYALTDLLGEMRFAGIRWATILAVAFCGIDFAGIARLLMPDEPATGTREAWFLFGAWLLAATLNATLTWWGVAMALTNHAVSSTSIVDASVISRTVPIFVAVIVWVTRILLISTLSSAGQKVFAQADQSVADLRPVTAAPAREYTRPQREQPRSAAATHRPVAPPPPVKHDRPVTRPKSAQIPAAQPVKPAADETVEDTLPPEPEYIPDPSYTPARTAFHSLSARAGDTRGNHSTRRS